MKGCRPLNTTEYTAFVVALECPRNKALFVLGVRSGFRISELLSLSVRDVWQHGAVVDRVEVQRAHTKGGYESKNLPLHPEARAALHDYILSEKRSSGPLFLSRKGGSITRQQAWRIIKEVANAMRLSGRVATHSMRKTFAEKIYLATGKDLMRTQQALRHRNMNSTVSYLSFDSQGLDSIITGIE